MAGARELPRVNWDNVRRAAGPPSRDDVEQYVESLGYAFLGPSSWEGDPDYEPPPPDEAWELMAVQHRSSIALYRVRKRRTS